LLKKREKSHPHLCCRRRRKAPYPPAATERVYLTAWSHPYWDISWHRAALREKAENAEDEEKMKKEEKENEEISV